MKKILNHDGKIIMFDLSHDTKNKNIFINEIKTF